MFEFAFPNTYLNLCLQPLSEKPTLQDSFLIGNIFSLFPFIIQLIFIVPIGKEIDKNGSRNFYSILSGFLFLLGFLFFSIIFNNICGGNELRLIILTISLIFIAFGSILISLSFHTIIPFFVENINLYGLFFGIMTFFKNIFIFIFTTNINFQNVNGYEFDEHDLAKFQKIFEICLVTVFVGFVGFLIIEYYDQRNGKILSKIRPFEN